MTLIEIFITVVILSLVATAGVFASRGLLEGGDESACEIEVREVNAALRAYYSDTRVWLTTATLSSLVPDYLDEAPSAAGDSGAGTVGADRLYRGEKC